MENDKWNKGKMVGDRDKRRNGTGEKSLFVQDED